MKTFYLLAAILGTVLPWFSFATYFAENGMHMPGFVYSVFANAPATGFTLDILISIGVFWIWSFQDARSKGIKNWWLVLPATLMVGLSLSLPLYLYLRETKLKNESDIATRAL